MQKTSLTLGLLALVGIISPSGIYAATPPPPADIDTDVMARDYRDTINDAGALTKEMIEACVVLKIDLEKDASNLDQLRDELSTLNNEVKNLGAYLKNNKGQFDDNDTSAARTEYDDKIKEYNKRLPLMKEKTQEYQEKDKAYKEKELKFDQECNDQPYYEDDYKAIEEKMGRGI